MNSNNKSKRSRDAQTRSSRRAVVFSPRSPYQNRTLELDDCTERLKKILAHHNKKENTVYSHVENIKSIRTEKIDSEVEKKRTDATHHLNQAVAKLQEAEAHHRAESSAIDALAEDLKNIKHEADSIRQRKEACENEVERLQLENSAFERAIEQEEVLVRRSRGQKSAEIDRLQKQSSLFAGITGIKWDFIAQEQEFDLLAGEIKVPSQKTIRSFKFDTSYDTKFFIANSLWGMMDGEDDS